MWVAYRAGGGGGVGGGRLIHWFGGGRAGGGVEDDLVSYLLLLFLQLCDCWFILVLWFSCSGLRWIRLLTSFPLSLFFLSLLFMLLFLLRFILAVFSFRFFSLGFLREEREKEKKKHFVLALNTLTKSLKIECYMKKNHNASFVAQVTKTQEINHGWRGLTWI